MYIVFLLSLILLFLYVFLLRDFRKAWKKESFFSHTQAAALTPFSILIPFRNEKQRIASLVNRIKAMDTANTHTAIIFIDDFSTDGTQEFIRKTLGGRPEIRILEPEGVPGKKNALRRGVLAANHEWVVSIDADCTIPPSYIQTLSAFIGTGDFVLISGPVRMTPSDSGFFQKFQAIEFMSLNGIGGASVLAGMPLMCNGANLCFKKSFFLEAFPHLHPHFGGGDDMFLLEYAQKEYPGKISFLKSRDALADTLSESNWFAFLRQRSRWTSKAPLYRNPDLLRVAVLVFLMNFWFLILVLGGITNPQLFAVLAGWWLSKSLADYWFLREINRLYEHKLNFYQVALFQMVYPFYILASAAGGMAGFILRSKNEKNG
jgi:cellulose synthase/poly-beta-1,6-N-acetylglucosamine synthase-like glycosyltransferase